MSSTACQSMVEAKSGGAHGGRQALLHGLHGVRVAPNLSVEEIMPCSPVKNLQSQLPPIDRRRRSSSSSSQILKARAHSGGPNFVLMQQSLRRLWKDRPSLFMLPIPRKHGDCHLTETIANVITSVPFILIGLRAPRNKVVTRLYANSIIGVGLVSSLYHTSRGDARKIFRWGDYAMISTAALCLTRALRSDNQRALIMASALLLPFKPSFVTAIHTGLTEATFYQRASADPGLKSAHTLHAASSLVGCALFVADNRLPDIPFIHAAWHLTAAVGVATYNKLLE